MSLARRHVDTATKADDRVIVIPGIGHFESASPQSSSACPTVLETIRSLVAN